MVDRPRMGPWGEDAAARHAWWRGGRVLARNWRGRAGELDMVLRHWGTLVFAEVKTRSREADRYGLAAVNRTKQRRIVRTAEEYLAAHGLSSTQLPCRFDVFLVQPRQGRRPRVTWLKGAFEGSTSGR